VVAAWGRDYTDVPPLKGVIFTEGTTHDLEVMVDVVRLDDGAV
jgi:transglutaminase-like putative cysteine protease